LRTITDIINLFSSVLTAATFLWSEIWKLLTPGFYLSILHKGIMEVTKTASEGAYKSLKSTEDAIESLELINILNIYNFKMNIKKPKSETDIDEIANSTGGMGFVGSQQIESYY
jgi:hypothetical protein